MSRWSTPGEAYAYETGYIEGMADAKEKQWIPVTERLPDDLSEVNITWINTDPESYYEFCRNRPVVGSGVYYKGRWYWYSSVCIDLLGEYGISPGDEMDEAIKVIAWMPLPEPLKGEDDANHSQI